MRNENHDLKFSQPLIVLAIFVLIIAVLIMIFSSISQARKDSIYQTYAVETAQYINQNQPQLATLFNDMFPKTECIINRQQNIPCAFPNQEAIARLLPSSLKDWSSTAFIKEGGERILMMRLSGDTKELYVYPEQKRLQLQKLLRGETTKIGWDDYTYELMGKEVVIAVKDSNGKVIGAIMRSVIEVQ
ncbi:hypothetical protein HYU93_03550 [Candidatus Daviesbacteria bacterium]|nr:hypothetical protein [Candidatus Daviesbacteria bacterium]